MGSDQTISGIPIFDFSREKLVPGTSHWVETRDGVRKAMEDQGCFVAEYDVMKPEHHESLIESMKEMYGLPYEVKIKNGNHKASHGYMSMTAEDYKIHESLGIDFSTEIESCRNFTSLMWPEGNDSFCEIVHSYAKVQEELDRKVMSMLFESYGLDVKKHMEEHAESTRYLLRLLSYRQQQNGDPNTAFVSHTDKSFMTILHQNHVPGLQLMSKDGDWVDFEPSRTRFVVLAGMGITAWSNDRIKACYHRVVMRGEEVRYSMGFFSFCKGVIQTPMELVDEEHPLKYKPFQHDALLRFYESYLYQNKSSKDLLTHFCGIITD